MGRKNSRPGATRASLFKRSLALWIGLFTLAFVNGALRELFIRKFIEEPWAHRLSALTAMSIFWIYVDRLWNRSGITNRGDAARVGAIWLFLTILTETFALNRWLAGLSWEQILQTYNIFSGNLWTAVLIWIAALPTVVLKLRGRPS